MTGVLGYGNIFGIQNFNLETFESILIVKQYRDLVGFR